MDPKPAKELVAGAGAAAAGAADGTYSLIESKSDGLNALAWVKGFRNGCPSSGGAEEVRPGIYVCDIL